MFFGIRIKQLLHIYANTNIKCCLILHLWYKFYVNKDEHAHRFEISGELLEREKGRERER
jgi:hypothetical protein